MKRLQAVAMAALLILTTLPGAGAQRPSDGEFGISVFFFIYENAAVFDGESCRLADQSVDYIRLITSNQNHTDMYLSDFLAVSASAEHSPVKNQPGCLLGANVQVPAGSFAMFVLGDVFLGNFKKSDLHSSGYAYIAVDAKGATTDDTAFLGEDALFDSVEELFNLEVSRGRGSQVREGDTSSQRAARTPTVVPTQIAYDNADPVDPIPYLPTVKTATQMAYINGGTITASSPIALTIGVYEFSTLDEAMAATSSACSDIESYYLGYGPSEPLTIDGAECGYGNGNMIVTFLFQTEQYLVTVTVGAGAFATEWVIALAGNQGVENLPSVTSRRSVGDPWKLWSGPTSITEYTVTPTDDRP